MCVAVRVALQLFQCKLHCNIRDGVALQRTRRCAMAVRLVEFLKSQLAAQFTIYDKGLCD